AFAFRGMNLLVAFATILITAGGLDDDEYGAFVLGLAFVGITNAVAGGLTASTAYQVANQRRSSATALANGGVPGAVFAALAICVGLGVAALADGWVASEALPVAVAASAVILNSAMAGVFLGRESFVRYNVALVAPPLLALTFIAAAFLLVDDRTPELALWMYALGQWTAIIMLFLVSVRSFTGVPALSPRLMRTVVRFAALAGLSSGISFLNYRADLFVVERFEGTSGAGTYFLAVGLAESVWQVSGSLTLATYARLGSLSRTDAALLTTRVMRHTIVLLGAFCLALFLLADVIEAALFSTHDQMSTALRLLLPGVLLYGLAQSFSGFYTYQRGLPWAAAVVAGTGLVIDIALAFALVPPYGVPGAAAASSIAYGTAIICALAVFVRQERLRPGDVFRFGRADLDDYRSLVTRVRGALRAARRSPSR
ncbi:MAG: polysaccharide biosynthesis C-terminal domain-containing protein, partial [Dehalococcoidia bacterium]